MPDALHFRMPQYVGNGRQENGEQCQEGNAAFLPDMPCQAMVDVLLVPRKDRAMMNRAPDDGKGSIGKGNGGNE